MKTKLIALLTLLSLTSANSARCSARRAPSSAVPRASAARSVRLVRADSVVATWVATSEPHTII